MESSLLHYDEKSGQFWFPYGKSQMPYPCSLGRAGNERIAVFSGRYPMSIVGARVFKGIYPDGQATQPALLKIQEAKNVENQLTTHKVVSDFENDFLFPPYEHQRDAIEHMLHYERLALLLEQGLGKTYISLMAFDILKKQGLANRALIICPNIVFHNWIAETAKYTRLNLLTYKGDPEMRSEQRENFANLPWDVALTTFDMLIDRSKAPKALYVELWRQMDAAKKVKLATWWKDAGKIDETQMKVLLSNDKKSYAEQQGTILRSLPKTMLPLNNYLSKIREYSNQNFLRSLDFDVLIVDEASRCLDHTTRRSQAVEALAIKARRCYLLSGTLCVGRPTDMFMPMNILAPDILGMSWKRFTDVYCTKSTTNKHIIVAYKNLDNLKQRIDPHIIAKTREECIDLPKRIIVQRLCDPTSEMRSLYNSIATREYTTVNGAKIETSSILVRIAKCMQVVNGFIYYQEASDKCNECSRVVECVKNNIQQGSSRCTYPGADKAGRKTMLLKTNPKIEMLREDLADGGDEKTIIWAWHQEDLRAISQVLQEEKIPYILAGEKNSALAYENDPKLRVFLGQTSQGIGITLNSATCTIYFSHGTALEPRLQSMDRNYRIGQEKPVIVKDYLVKGTVEESLVRLLMHKTDVKTFMQQRIQCFTCAKLNKCQENNISYLGEKCIHYGEKLNAETVRRLRLPVINED